MTLRSPCLSLSLCLAVSRPSLLLPLAACCPEMMKRGDERVTTDEGGGQSLSHKLRLMKTSGLLKLNGNGRSWNWWVCGKFEISSSYLYSVLVTPVSQTVNKYTCGKLTRTQKASRKILRMRMYGRHAIGRQRNQPNRVID